MAAPDRRRVVSWFLVAASAEFVWLVFLAWMAVG
jgi:hypothetical protein